MDRSERKRLRVTLAALTWPRISRASGLAMLFYTVGLASPADKPTYVAVVLVLLTGPAVAGEQGRRNRRRGGDDE